jgi:hypothetical protein
MSSFLLVTRRKRKKRKRVERKDFFSFRLHAFALEPEEKKNRWL